MLSKNGAGAHHDVLGTPGAARPKSEPPTSPPGLRVSDGMHTQAELVELAQTMLAWDRTEFAAMPLRRRLRNALALTLELAAYSTLGLAVLALFWLPRRYLPLEPGWSFHVEDKEPPIRSREYKPALEIVYYLNFDIPLMFFFPTTFALYLSASRRQTIFLLMFSFAVLVTFRGYAYPAFDLPATIIPLSAPVLQFRLLMGPGTMIPLAAVRAGCNLAMGLAMHGVLSSFPADTDSRRLIIAAIVIPFFKEVMCALARGLAAHMTFSSRLSARGHVLRREMAWAIHQWVQIFMALILRLFVTRFETTAALALAVVFQSFSELFTRLTMGWRDQIMNSLLVKIFRIKKNSIVMPAPLERSLRSMPLHKLEPASAMLTERSSQRELLEEFFQAERVDPVRKFCKRHFHASVAAGEMLSEYLAILLAPMVLIAFESAQLQLPFDQFAQHGDFNVAPLDRKELLFGTLLQLAAELVVDVVCVCFEEARGFRITRAWQLRPQYFPALFIWAAWYASVLCYAMVANRDDFTNCLDENICKCANGHGLYPFGVRQLYCEYVYNNTANPGTPDD